MMTAVGPSPKIDRNLPDRQTKYGCVALAVEPQSGVSGVKSVTGQSLDSTPITQSSLTTPRTMVQCQTFRTRDTFL